MVVFSHIYRTGGRTLQKMFPTLLVIATERFKHRPKGYQFTQVRNPFAWQLSVFNYIHRQKEHPDHHIVKHMSFENYLNWFTINESYNTQYGFLKGVEYDFTGRLESIEQSVEYLASVLKVPVPKMGWITDTKKPIKNHRKYYNKKTRLLLEKIFADDLNYYGYDF